VAQRHTTYAEKFQLLLAHFPHPERRDHPDPEKRKWKMSEISHGTANSLTPPYLSGVLRGKNNKPSMRPLDTIANVMGFPVELWMAEPDQWNRVLRDHGWHLPASETDRVNEDSTLGGDTMADLVDKLFDTIINRRTGKLFTIEEAANHSDGRLTTADIESMLVGELENPSRSQLLALCDVFGVDFAYFSTTAAERPLLDSETQQAIKNVQENRQYHVAQKSLGMSNEHLDLILMLMEQMRDGSSQADADQDHDTPNS
jgi:transcriptional regulator with XRE-family HTH domain